MDRGGQQSQRLHAEWFKKLSLQHIQLDEWVTKVRQRVKRVWIWTGIDVQTKLLLAWVVGGRSQADANQLVHQLENRLEQDHVPVFTSDGLNQYFYALTAHFGCWIVVEGKRKPVWIVAPNLLYGQLRKTRSRYRLKNIYTRMLWGQRSDMKQQLQDIELTSKIQTAYVERLNLTLRHIVSALRRRTWALADNSSLPAITLRLRGCLLQLLPPSSSSQRNPLSLPHTGHGSRGHRPSLESQGVRFTSRLLIFVPLQACLDS